MTVQRGGLLIMHTNSALMPCLLGECPQNCLGFWFESQAQAARSSQAAPSCFVAHAGAIALGHPIGEWSCGVALVCSTGAQPASLGQMCHVAPALRSPLLQCCAAQLAHRRTFRASSPQAAPAPARL